MGARVVARREAAIRINGQANRFLQVNFSWTLNQETWWTRYRERGFSAYGTHAPGFYFNFRESRL